MRLPTRLLASLSAIGVLALLSGCVAVPVDPYYGGYGYSTAPAYVGTAGYYDGYGYGYGYGAFGGPVVLAPPALSIGIGGVFGRGWHGHDGYGHGWRGRPGWGGHYGGYRGYRGGGGWGHGGRR